MSSCIYLLTNTINQKQYVGFALDFKVRMREHKKLADSGNGYHLHNAIRKYDWVNFTKEIVYMSKDDHHCLNTMENHFIIKHNTFYKNGLGYNHTFGGGGALGHIHSAESKQKISDGSKEFNERRTIKIPDKIGLETLYNQNMSLSQIGEQYNVSHGTIRKWLKKLEIKTRDNLPKVDNKPSKEKLQELYDRPLSCQDIGNLYNVTNMSVIKWMKKYECVFRSRQQSQKMICGAKLSMKMPEKADLLAVYTKYKSLRKTGFHFKTSNTTAKKWLKHYNIDYNAIR